MCKEKHLKKNKAIELILSSRLPDIAEKIANCAADFIEHIDISISEFGQNIRF